MFAAFRYPRGICMDSHGNLYIADGRGTTASASWTRKAMSPWPLEAAGSVGVQSPGDWVDGPDTTARFWTPCGLEIDAADNLYLADAYNHRIRLIDPQGMVTTLAGNGPGGSTSGAYLDGSNAIARLNTPTGLGLGKPW
ncbi:MAG: hypothetical protein U0176_03705 [Bacteroidia bacterium]